jgi:WD40 repeat protein
VVHRGLASRAQLGARRQARTRDLRSWRPEACGGTECKVLLWSVVDGTLFEELPIPVKGVYQLGFSPHGRRLAMAAADKRGRVWELS